jgi:hypothetical protein
MALTGFRILAVVLLPLPLVLTTLLVLPLSRNARKGVLVFVHKTLGVTMMGGLKLVHFSLIASGLPLLDAAFKTAHSGRAAHAAAELRPEVRAAVLGKKWREERNF